MLAVLAGRGWKNRNLSLFLIYSTQTGLFLKQRSKQNAGLFAQPPPPPCFWGQTVKICRRRPHAWCPKTFDLFDKELFIFFSCRTLYQTVASCLDLKKIIINVLRENNWVTQVLCYFFIYIEVIFNQQVCLLTYHKPQNNGNYPNDVSFRLQQFCCPGH